MSDFRYQLADAYGNVLYSDLRERERRLLNEVTQPSVLVSRQLRVGTVSSNLGNIFGASNNPDYIKSTQKFRTKLETILSSIEYVEKAIGTHRDATNASTRRLIHNLTSLNAHVIQEIYSLVPQELLAGKTKNHVDVVREIILESPRDAALALLAIAKANTSMKTEFSVFKNLFNPQPYLQKKHHVVHKVLMNVLYLFFPDFTDKNVYVLVNESTLTAWFDYESIHVALYHLIDNSAKYTKPDSRLFVEILERDKNAVISFKMTSLKIAEYEIQTIFEEGFSGELAKKTGKSGNGIGTFIMKKMVDLNEGTLNINIHPETVESIMGIEYQANDFEIVIPRKPSDSTRRFKPSTT